MANRKLDFINATASSFYTNGEPIRSISGDTSTGWLAGNTNVNHHIVLELKSIEFVKKIKLMNNVGFVTNNYTNHSGSIYYSEDGVSYTLFGSWSGYSTTSQWLEVENENLVKAKYIKITDLTNFVGSRHIVRIGQVEAYSYHNKILILSPSGSVKSLNNNSLITLPSSSEQNFITYGMDRSSSYDLTSVRNQEIFIKQESEALGSGKVFKQKIDTSKTPIKSVSIT